VLAATFVHNKFRAGATRSCANPMLFGGTRDEEILQRSEDEILALVRRELQHIFEIASEPLLVRVFKWKRAMAQYGVGHGARVERIHGLSAGCQAGAGRKCLRWDWGAGCVREGRMRRLGSYVGSRFLTEMIVFALSWETQLFAPLQIRCGAREGTCR